MFGLINTRPIWNEDDKLWADKLRFELNDVEIMDAPLQELSLTDSSNVGNKLSSWLNIIDLKKSSGYLIFTSPSSVKALAKHLSFFDIEKKQSPNFSMNNCQIINRLVAGISKRRIRAATIGIGTKNQLIELINNLIPVMSDSKKFFLTELIFVKDNANSVSFLQLHKNKFIDGNILVLEGEGNKPTLVNGLKTNSNYVIGLSLYRRKDLQLPALTSFCNKVNNNEVLPKEEINFNMQVFLLLSSSSIANLAKKELKKQKVMLNSLIVLSHHDRIIEVMKEECHDIKFYKIISLTPKLIADEVKKHLA